MRCLSVLPAPRHQTYRQYQRIGPFEHVCMRSACIATEAGFVMHP